MVVESLAQEFDIVAHRGRGGEAGARGRGRRRDGTRDPGRRCRRRHGPAPVTRCRRAAPRTRRADGRATAAPAEDVARLFVGAGREAGIRPGDLVGAITGEAGIKSRDLGAIEIADRFSLIDVPESRAEEIMAALRATTLPRARR